MFLDRGGIDSDIYDRIMSEVKVMDMAGGKPDGPS
jgi:hypothetical protein